MNSEDKFFYETLEKTLPLGRGVKIAAAHACGIFALEKPAGTKTHPNAPGLNAARDALFVADYSPKNECYACRVPAGGIRKIFVLNRLDSPTSGIVLAATDERVAVAARRAFAEENVRKIYHAVVRGVPVPARGEWTDFLRRVRGSDGTLRVQIARGNARDSLFAKTFFEIERTGKFAVGGSAIACAQIRLEPATGRTHQLRVQCASRKFPIVGDKTYGDFHLNSRVAENGIRARLFLHCAATEIAFPWRGGIVKFSAESPLPREFSDFFENPKS